MTIPTTNFTGFIKQMPSEGLNPQGQEALDRFFPEFRDEGVLAEHLRVAGIKRVVTSMGTRVTATGRLRRYSGGASLSRGRYFSVCVSEKGNDGGTLVHELMAYSRRAEGIELTVVDSTMDSDSADFIRESCGGTMPYRDFLALVLMPVDQKGEPQRGADVVTLKLNIFQAKIENVLDLRLRSVQDWFARHFLELERAACESAAGRVHTVKRALKDFRELLPTLLAHERGGNVFHDAIGGWLRRQGVNALVFPSARMNVSVSTSDDIVHSFHGWNLVVYGGRMPVEEASDMTAFGQSAWTRDEDAKIRAIRWEDDGSNRTWSVEKY